jgi:hypothetical protein
VIKSINPQMSLADAHAAACQIGYPSRRAPAACRARPATAGL